MSFMYSKIRFRLPLALVGFSLIVMGIIILTVLSGVQSFGKQEKDYQTVVVSKGDTLWAIALRVKPNMDPRKTVFHIKKANGMESVDIAPGQVLLVPVDL